MCNLLQFALHNGVIQPIAFVFCSHPVCFVERLMLQLCVICVLHTNVIIVANMRFVHILLLSSSVPRPQDVCTVTTFFAFFVCPYTQLTSTTYFFFDFNFFLVWFLSLIQMTPTKKRHEPLPFFLF